MRLLDEIGRHLDGYVFPVVKNGGIVMPSQAAVPFQSLGMEFDHEQKAARGSAADTRARAQGWQRPSGGAQSAGRPWSSCATAPFVDGVHVYRDPLASVRDAYPDSQVWRQQEGFWLTTRIALLPNLERRARLLVAVSERHRIVRSWAFWDGGVVGATWIGPRHTNFPDGSICAFDLADGTWSFGESLIALLDIYTLWVLRQLHLEVLGRWPGPQSVPYLYERLVEFRDGELCGCANSQRQYADCCKDSDLAKSRIREAIAFNNAIGWQDRNPPAAVYASMLIQRPPPELQDIIC